MKISFAFIIVVLLGGCLDVSPPGSNARVLSGPGWSALLVDSVVTNSEPPEPLQDPYYVNASVSGTIRHESRELRLYPADSISGAENLEYLVLSGDTSTVGLYGSESEVGNIPGLITDDVPDANARYFQIGIYSMPLPDKAGQIVSGPNHMLLRTPIARKVRIYYDYARPPEPVVVNQWSYFTDAIEEWPNAERDSESEAYILAVMLLSNNTRKYLLNGISHAEEQNLIATGWFRSVIQVDMVLSRCIRMDGSGELMRAILMYDAGNPGAKIGIFGEQVGYENNTPDREFCGSNFWGGTDIGIDVFNVTKYTIN